MSDYSFNYNLISMTKSESAPAWYRAEHYENCDSMISLTTKNTLSSLFHRFVNFFA